jgi:hypothetical protein
MILMAVGGEFRGRSDEDRGRKTGVSSKEGGGGVSSNRHFQLN